MQNQVLSISRGFEIVASFPELRGKPIIIGESDPEGCAACPVTTYPQNAYRNGPLYATYTAAMYAHTLELADRYHVQLAGAVTWAFEFENQPWFAGFRTLATNGVDKAIMNVFRMFGLMGGECVEAASDGTVPLDDVLARGVREKPDINALATRETSSAAALVWNYHDDDVGVPPAPLTLLVNGLGNQGKPVLVRHYRIDAGHSNAFEVWKQIGAPPMPTPEQYSQLQAAAQLTPLHSPRWLRSESEAVTIRFEHSRQSVSLLELSW